MAPGSDGGDGGQGHRQPFLSWLLRLIYSIALLGIFVADYHEAGIFRREVPDVVYLALLGLAAGVEQETIKEIIAAFLRKRAGLSSEKEKDPDA